jgi:hypothetical protein
MQMKVKQTAIEFELWITQEGYTLG